MATKKEEIVINAEKRTVKGKKVAQLRRQDLLPGVIYGRHLEALPIQMNAHEAGLQLSRLTGSTIVTINVEGKEHNAIMRDLQRDVIFNRPLHVDFLAISMREKLKANIDLVLVGEAPVLKLGEYIINQGVERVEVEALPADLPERIEVDLSVLNTPEDLITIADLKLDKDVTILTDASEVIASVGRPAVEAEPAEAEEDAAVAEPEVMEKGKKEEDAEAE